MEQDQEKLKAIVTNLVQNYGVEKIEVSTEPQILDEKTSAYTTHESDDKCEWVEEKGDANTTIWRCKQTAGETCDKGSCKSTVITSVVNGVRKTVSYCACG